MSNSDELAARNLALIATLDEALIELEDALQYKFEYLVQKHKDLETLEELRQSLDSLNVNSDEMLRNIQADAIENLQFPTMLRKMWSGNEVQEWLKEQAKTKRKK